MSWAAIALASSGPRSPTPPSTASPTGAYVKSQRAPTWFLVRPNEDAPRRNAAAGACALGGPDAGRYRRLGVRRPGLQRGHQRPAAGLGPAPGPGPAPAGGAGHSRFRAGADLAQDW